MRGRLSKLGRSATTFYIAQRLPRDLVRAAAPKIETTEPGCELCRTPGIGVSEAAPPAATRHAVRPAARVTWRAGPMRGAVTARWVRGRNRAAHSEGHRWRYP